MSSQNGIGAATGGSARSAAKVIAKWLFTPLRWPRRDNAESGHPLLKLLEQGIMPMALVDHRSDQVVCMNAALVSWLPVDLKASPLIYPLQSWSTLAQSQAAKLALPAHLQNTQDLADGRETHSALEDQVDLDGDRIIRRLCRAVWDGDGRYLGHLYQFEDITQQLVQQKALKRKVDHYRILLELSVDWTWTWHCATNHVMFAGNLRGAMGDPGKQYLDCQGVIKKIPDMMGSDWRTWLMTLHFEQRFRDLLVYCPESDGSKRIFLVNGSPVRDGAGRLIGFSGSAIDQTSYRLTSNASTHQERRHDDTTWSWFNPPSN